MGKGKLVFKGEKSKKKKKKVKHDISSETESSKLSSTSTYEGNTSMGHITSSKAKKPEASSAPSIQKGTGSITSSGVVIHGLGTKFSSTIKSGDALLVDVEVDGTSREEMRVVTMSLSDTSASISSAFSSDLKTPTPFKYIKKPKNVAKERADREKKEKLGNEELERTAFGTYSKGALVYRERTENGSYRIVREEVSDDISRSDLLHMRQQKKSDKYC